MDLSQNFTKELDNQNYVSEKAINFYDDLGTATSPKMNFEIDCCYEILFEDNTKLIVQYQLIYNDNKFRPYGIESIAKDINGNIIEHNITHNKFTSIDECVNIMKILAKELVLPSNLDYII